MEFYHAIFAFNGGGTSHNSNLTKEGLIQKILTPYMNGQCIADKFQDMEGYGLINLNAALVMIIIKTDQELDEKVFQFANIKTVLQQIKLSSNNVKICTKELLEEAEIGLADNNITNYKGSVNKSQVFTVMKIGDEVMDSAYASIKLVLEEFNLNVIRVDEVEHSGSITDKILDFIKESKYILVELTGSRPNCYYEAGYADALGKEIIYVIKKGEEIHFDLKHRAFIIWNTESELREKIRTRFQALTAENNGFYLY